MGTWEPNNTAQQAHTMGKKDKKRSADEAGLVAVEAGASSAAGVGLPVADEGETTTMDVDTSTAGEPTKKKKKSSKKDKDGAAAADRSSRSQQTHSPRSHTRSLARSSPRRCSRLSRRL